MDRLIDLSLRYKFLVLVLTVVVIGAGINSMLRLPIDAVPDVTPNQVLVLTSAPGLGPLEVERSVTFPVETSMSGLPGIAEIRSVSRFGLSSVTIFFNEDVDVYFARRLVLNVCQTPARPSPLDSARRRWGRLAPGLGEIYQFEVRGDKYSAHGTALHSRVGHRVQVAVSPGGRRDQHLRRRTEDLRGPARSGQAGRLQCLAGPGVHRPREEQRQYRRCLHRTRSGAVRHSR